MKTSSNTKKRSHSNSHSPKSFLNKSGEGSFFSRSHKVATPFFESSIMQLKLATEERREGIETIQGKFEPIHKKENKTGLPDNLKSGIENFSGYSINDVKVHYNSDKPAQLKAHAYTQGTTIQLAQGQEKHLPHEAWHVVQQKQGRVQPSAQLKNTTINDDPVLEKEADEMGAKSAAFLPSTEDSKDANIKTSLSPLNAPIQMKRIPTHFGVFEDEKYTDNGTDSVSMILKFEPGPKIDAKKIGLIQSVKELKGGNLSLQDPQQEHRTVKKGPGTNFAIDRITSRNIPVYGSDDLGTGKGLEDTKQDNNPTANPTKVGPGAEGGNATYQLGHHYNDGSLKKKDAKLYDAPKSFSSAKSGMEFETTALALEGAQKRTYYGSVKWGYEVDAAGTFKKIELDGVSMGVPSQNFLAPAELWNAAKTIGSMVIKADNTPILDGSLAEKFKAAKNDEFIYKSSAKAGDQVYCFVEKKGDTTKNGYVKIEEIRDKGDGKEMVDLPVPIVMKTTKAIPLTSDIDGKNKIVDLPKDTRVQNTFCHISGKYKIDVVDGTHIGKSGYVNGTDLKTEKQ